MSERTGPLSGRQAEAARNDGRILEAARTVFLRDPHAPIAAVATEAGVGVGALYRRYASKEVLLQTLCSDGLARFLEIAAHGTTVIGSPPYMAPEQFQGKAVFASDVYSLGVTLFQLLTGTLPYEPPSPADLGRLASGEFLVAPRSRNPKLLCAAGSSR